MARRWLGLSLVFSAGLLASGCGGGGGSAPPPAITVSVSPNSANVRLGDSQRFHAAVANAMNTAVTWSVNGVAGGNAQTGTIDAGGNYTPPQTLPSPNSVQITATSVEDTSKSGNAAAVVQNPIAVISYVSPPALSPNSPFALTIYGSKFVSGAQVLMGSTALPTVFVDSSHLMATGTASGPGVVNLTVVNPDPGSAASAAAGIGVAVVSQRAAVRFLEQTTFGPSHGQVLVVETNGMESFLGTQYQAAASDYPDTPPGTFTLIPMDSVFFQNALNSSDTSDQLRQRVVFALNQIWVTSGNKLSAPDFYVPYLRVLGRNAFGNYRNLMEDVTLNPMMGNYLDMVNNVKPDPIAGTHANENYARELLQLFTLGPNLLNPDGTPQHQNGQLIPTYDQSTIQALALALTGWTYAGGDPCAQNGFFGNGGSPMVSCDGNHDMTAKTVLGTTIPAGQGAQQDLDAALDVVFNHPNLPPFVARRMIQHLVTSNPSPAYVARAAGSFIAGTFTSNGTVFGSGQRGDMQVLIAAILLDPEARRGDDPVTENPGDGHLREPVLLVTAILRGLNGTTNANNNLGFVSADMGGELPFYAPSVFNFFSPDYAIPLTQPPLLGPEFQIFTTASTLTRVNDMEGLIFFTSQVDPSTQIDPSVYVALAANDAGAMVDAMNLDFLHGTMSGPMRTAILSAVNAVSNTDPVTRAKTAVYLVTLSSQYQVQR